MDNDSPLQEEHFQQIREGLIQLDQAQRLVDQAIRAGIGVKEQQDKVQELRIALLKLRTAYFPGRT